jgi:hypothetical protein
MGANLAPASITLAYSFVASVFKAAVEHRIIAFTPCTNIPLANVDKAKVVPLTTETVDALVDSVPDR